MDLNATFLGIKMDIMIISIDIIFALLVHIFKHIRVKLGTILNNLLVREHAFVLLDAPPTGVFQETGGLWQVVAGFFGFRGNRVQVGGSRGLRFRVVELLAEEIGQEEQ